MNQPVNNMDRSLIMGVDATVSSGNINNMQYNLYFQMQHLYQ